jgi:hypothetical protein
MSLEIGKVKAPGPSAHSCERVAVMVALTVFGLRPDAGDAQITPEQTTQIRSTTGARVEALTILGGDFGLSDGTFKSSGDGLFRPGSTDTRLDVTKLGGAGDIGDPQPLGDLGIGWQPRLQGNMGYLESTNRFLEPLLIGDVSKFRDLAIQFGGGARFWVSDALSFAPTFMGMYGHTSNTYAATSAFMRANLATATQLGLVNWRVDTWTLRPALDIQYVLTWNRAIITLSSDPTYFHTESFSSSNVAVLVDGDSGSWANKVDLDLPLGVELYGHELRVGGYFSRTELFGDLKTGLDVEHVNELHARLVLDFLGQFWKVQWIGIGGSYLTGTNINGWTVGADVAFRF